MKCSYFDITLSTQEEFLIVRSLRYAKKNLSGILASQEDFDHVLSLFSNCD